LNILEDYSLKTLNTFGLDVQGKYFVEIRSHDEFRDLLQTNIYRTNKKLILGGGSNILFTQNFPGLIIHNQLLGIDVVEQNEDFAIIAAAGGENWHELVEYAISQNLGGIENLSLKPGSVGAAPIQNIGAYGVELREVLDFVEAIDLTNGKDRKFSNAECDFNYRNSVFKNELKDKFLITKVYLKLNKNHEVNTTYGAIESILSTKNITNPTIKDISNIVIEIRQSKLPDPSQFGNAGSFFKNPVIDKIDYEGLRLLFADIPSYINGDQVKIPAAWLIEQCGWKGKRFGAIGVHDQQSLVLVNYGNGDGEEIKNLALKIKGSVADKFGIELEPEPRII